MAIFMGPAARETLNNYTKLYHPNFCNYKDDFTFFLYSKLVGRNEFYIIVLWAIKWTIKKVLTKL